MALRDIVLSLLLIAGLPVSLLRPYIGAVIFALLAIGNPHRLTWGFAEDVPWSLLYGMTTLAGLVFAKEREIGGALKAYWLVVAYTLWMMVTSTFALETDKAWTRFDGIWKVQIMCLATLMLLTNERKVMVLATTVIVSLLFYGLKGGFFTLTTGGDFRVWGPRGSVIQDNNQLASGLVTVIPLAYWLYRIATRNWMKWGLIAAASLSAVSVLGSYSRGAFLAASAAAIAILLKSDRKLAATIILIPAFFVGLTVMPEKYWERIQSIDNYEADSSATGRINTWKTAINIANNRITGGGLEYYGPYAFARFSPEPNRIHSSHNIFFQALGEHGWIGLFFYTLILWKFWQTARRLQKSKAAEDSPYRFDILGRVAQVSLIGFCVGGLTVNIGNWDFVFYIFVALLAADRLTSQKILTNQTGDTHRALIPGALLAQRSINS